MAPPAAARARLVSSNLPAHRGGNHPDHADQIRPVAAAEIAAVQGPVDEGVQPTDPGRAVIRPHVLAQPSRHRFGRRAARSSRHHRAGRDRPVAVQVDGPPGAQHAAPLRRQDHCHSAPRQPAAAPRLGSPPSSGPMPARSHRALQPRSRAVDAALAAAVASTAAARAEVRSRPLNRPWNGWLPAEAERQMQAVAPMAPAAAPGCALPRSPSAAP